MLDSLIKWELENPTYATLIATVIMAICAAYPVLKEVIPWLMRTLWDIVKSLFMFVWWLTTPIRYLFGLLFELLEDLLTRLHNKKTPTEE